MTTEAHQSDGPVLVCFDGSDGSREAIATAADLLVPRAAVVLTVWESVAQRLSAGGLEAATGMTYLTDEGDLDERERQTAERAAEQGAQSARERGWDATSRSEQVTTVVWQTIVAVADELDASLIVCGARGLSPIRRAVVGSVSEAVLHHAHRPVFISPLPHH